MNNKFVDEETAERLKTPLEIMRKYSEDTAGMTLAEKIAYEQSRLNQKEIEDLKLQIVYAKIDLKNAKSLVREDGTIVLRYNKFISLDEYEKAIQNFIQECEDKIRKLKQKGDNYVTNTD